MSCVIFSVFIATGHELSLSTAFTVLTILNIIKVSNGYINIKII